VFLGEQQSGAERARDDGPCPEKQERGAAELKYQVLEPLPPRCPGPPAPASPAHAKPLCVMCTLLSCATFKRATMVRAACPQSRHALGCAPDMRPASASCFLLAVGRQGGAGQGADTCRELLLSIFPYGPAQVASVCRRVPSGVGVGVAAGALRGGGWLCSVPGEKLVLHLQLLLQLLSPGDLVLQQQHAHLKTVLGMQQAAQRGAARLAAIDGGGRTRGCRSSCVQGGAGAALGPPHARVRCTAARRAGM
jgi:hypothetical protein